MACNYHQPECARSCSTRDSAHNMPIIEDSIDIKEEQEEIYHVTQDYKVRFKWDPFPDRLEMVGGGEYTPALGNQVYVRSSLHLSMVVEFVQIAPPSHMAIAMVSGPWFLKKFAGTWIINDTQSGVTKVRFRYLLQTQPACLRVLLDGIATAYFRLAIRNRLIALKKYCEAPSENILKQNKSVASRPGSL